MIVKYKGKILEGEIMERTNNNTIIWISRHDLTPRNIELIERGFKRKIDELEIIHIMETVDVEKLKELATLYNNAIFIVVLPIPLLMELLKLVPDRVYRFVVNRIDKGNGEVEFDPVALERVVKLEVVTEEVARLPQ